MPTTHLPRRTPESQGISSKSVLEFIEQVEKHGLEFHGFVLVRHGNVIAEGWWNPYSSGQVHLLYSYSKSFTSTAAGIAIAEGKFSLDDKVISFFPEDVPAEVSTNLAAMKVRHLLSMASGHTEEPPNNTENWVRSFLAKPVAKEPGTHFLYNSIATYMVSAIVQKTTGQRITDYLGSRLFQPLGIEKLVSTRCPSGIDIGGWGMSATTEDMAKLAQLYLQRGVWNGKRLLTEAWVVEASRSHVSNGTNPESDWNQGYGFQFWRSKYGCFRGDGAFGQYGVVMPAQDAVFAITSFVADMQKPLDLAWKHLLPAFQDKALPENPAAQKELAVRMERLIVPAPEGQRSSIRAKAVSGITYAFDANEQKISALRFDFGADEAQLTLKDENGEHIIRVGDGTWKRDTTTFKCNFAGKREFLRTAASGGWVSDDTFKFKLAFYETPFGPVITCRFHEKGVTFDMQGNIGFGPSERPKLEGRSGS